MTSHDRYSRQVLFAPLGEAGQAALGRARVTMVGCGALGTAQAELLTRAGVGRLRIIDRDFVEFSNLQRQSLFDESDAAAGLPKAAAAAARLARINSEVAAEPIVADLTPENAPTLLPASDLLLDATDNRETRELINDYAVEQNVPWIYGAVVASRGVGFLVRPGQTACLTCLFGQEGEAVVPGETCDTAGVLGWAVATAAAAQVSEAVKWLTGAHEALRDGLWSFDLWRNDFRELHRPRRDPECRTCVHRDFIHLRGAVRAAVTFCGRNAVQVHEHRSAIDLTDLARRLRAHGEVRTNAFALRFLPGQPAGLELTIFPDGRALIKGTTDAVQARSLYARYVGS